jgi:hypothetical protein
METGSVAERTEVAVSLEEGNTSVDAALGYQCVPETCLAPLLLIPLLSEL